MSKIRYILLITLTLLVSVQGFSQDKELIQVVVGNEGNFNAANATLTNYVIESNTATDGVFLDANGVNLGDVAQSISWIDDQIYVVLNNSQKIVVLDPDTFQQTGQISLGEGSSPREIVKVGEGKAYVTDLYASAVYNVDLNDYSVADSTIPAGKNADRIINHQGYAYVANNGFGADSTIFKIDVATDTVVDTLMVSRGPAGMAIDSDNTLWVVCTGYAGDYDDNWNLIEGTARPGGVHGIDLDTGEQVAHGELQSAGSDIALNEEEGKLYVNAGGVRAYDIATAEFAADTLVKGSFYAMGYEPVANNFYLADAKDFSSAGEVTIYGEQNGNTTTFDAGIIPGSFLFVYDDMTTTSTETEDIATHFTLEQNYPNPFNPTTNIKFSLARAGKVSLTIFTATGQKVAELINDYRPAGVHSVHFDASVLASGVYIYRVGTEHGSQAKKMILLK
ncbi:MAG: T9SS type A sorting domain-containing protein [Balneolaceae bacterium]|nr:T9SS type A sorting domain-containing protein [Balneolaceae bacterium]